MTTTPSHQETLDSTADAGSPARGKRRVRAWTINLALVGASVVFALVLAELVLRLLSPGYSPLFLSIYRQEPNGQVLLIPGIDRRHVTAEWSVRVTANAEGFRDHATPRPDSGGTVLGLGDSFAFGWGVELEEGLLARAETQLAQNAVRVVKAGIPGAGPGDELALLERYGTRYAPKVVVLSIFVGNDFNDVQLGGIPGQFTVRDGVMAKRSINDSATETPPLWYRMKERVKQSSLLAQEAAQFVWFLEQRFVAPRDRQNPGLNVRDRWLWEFMKVHLKTAPPETEEAFTLTLRALDGVQAWCQANNARLLLVVIPRSFQLYSWELAQWKTAYTLADADLDLDRPQRVLGDWARTQRVELLDLLPGFREHARANPDERLFFYPNSHMNRTGHAVAGELLAGRLRSMLAPSAR